MQEVVGRSVTPACVMHGSPDIIFAYVGSSYQCHVLLISGARGWQERGGTGVRAQANGRMLTQREGFGGRGGRSLARNLPRDGVRQPHSATLQLFTQAAQFLRAHTSITNKYTVIDTKTQQLPAACSPTVFRGNQLHVTSARSCGLA